MPRRASARSLDDVFHTLPADWSSWDVQRTHEFKVAMLDLQHARTLPKVIECAKRAAPFYGIDPRTIGGDDA